MSGNERWDFAAPVPPADSFARVHFIGVGGIGMSGIARLMALRGAQVSGCDARTSALTDALAAQGVAIETGHDPQHVAGVDAVVVGSAIRESNPELMAAREGSGVVLHRSQALASLLPGHRTVAVAGANGKSTTSAMATVAAQAAGLEPSYALGAQLVGAARNADAGAGDVFIVEADESDGSFLVYHPQVAIVTNIQPDHLDFYGDFDGVKAGYETFAQTVDPDGLLVVCTDDDAARDLGARRARAGHRVIGYGFAPVGEDFGAPAVQLGPARRDGGLWVSDLSGDLPVQIEGEDGSYAVRVPMAGEHNLLNATAAFLAVAVGLGAAPDAALRGLAAFPGTHRRFEFIGEAGGVRVVDDYAHNADKVAAAVRTARLEAGDGRVIVVFQPHLYSRTRDFAQGFAAGLSAADSVLVAPIYAAREDPLPGVSSALITDLLAESGHRDVTLLAHPDDAIAAVQARAQRGDVVMTVGAGDITELAPALVTALRAAP